MYQTDLLFLFINVSNRIKLEIDQDDPTSSSLMCHLHIAEEELKRNMNNISNSIQGYQTNWFYMIQLDLHLCIMLSLMASLIFWIIDFLVCLALCKYVHREQLENDNLSDLHSVSQFPYLVSEYWLVPSKHVIYIIVTSPKIAPSKNAERLLNRLLK